LESLHARYEECLGATSTEDSPWYVVPADDKDNARLIVSRIVIDALEGWKMAYPVTSTARKRALQAIRKVLVKQRSRGSAAARNQQTSILTRLAIRASSRDGNTCTLQRAPALPISGPAARLSDSSR
ncbi:hypothetical protein D7Y13_45000, partial [Corallococcus praedator]